jgi:hypothetical protein
VSERLAAEFSILVTALPNPLPPPEARDGVVHVQEPKQAEKSDQDNLAKDRVAVDKERDKAADDGRLN